MSSPPANPSTSAIAQVRVAAASLELADQLVALLQAALGAPADLRLRADTQSSLLESLDSGDAVLLIAPPLSASNGAASDAQATLMRTRQQLVARAQPFQLLYSQGDRLVDDALTALCNWFPNAHSLQARRAALREHGNLSNWSWTCEKCSDPECEFRIFKGLKGLVDPI